MCIRDRRKHNLEAKLEKVEHAIKSRTDDVVDFKPVSYTHLDGIRQFLGRVEDTFQTTETAVPLEYGTLFGCGRSLFPVDVYKRQRL